MNPARLQMWPAYLLLAVLVFTSGCKEYATEVLPGPVEPTITPIEGVSPVYNEPYRDSIIAIGPGGLNIIHKNGTGHRILVSTPMAFVSWTWNKRKILYSTPYDLFVMKPNGDSVKLISRQRELFNHALASPDGRRIAYVAKDTTAQGFSPGWIKVMYADGSGERFLTALQPMPTKVTWTPDSRSIIYNGADNVSRGVFIVAVEGSVPRCLYRDTTMLCNSVTLSRDGSTLAFTVPVDRAPGGAKILLLSMTSGQLHQLTFGNSYDDEPSWSADGSAIVYSRSEYQPPYHVWVGAWPWIVDVSSQTIHQLSIMDMGGCAWQ